jgi:hypothetical protein
MKTDMAHYWGCFLWGCCCYLLMASWTPHVQQVHQPVPPHTAGHPDPHTLPCLSTWSPSRRHTKQPLEDEYHTGA